MPRTTMALVAVLAAMLAVLAGCGGEGDDAATGTSGSGSHTVSHAMGSTEVAAGPERVVVLDTGELDSAVALGITPVGAVEAIAGAGFPDYLAERVEGVRTVGTIEQPSIEAIAALEPDLILSSKLRHEAIYDQLSRIAPTVFTEEVGVTWKENFRLHAEALGRSDDAERLMDEYDTAVSDLRARLAEGAEAPQISVVRSVGDEVRLYLNDNFIGTVLQDAGLPRPPAQDVEDFSSTLTLERLRDADGDVMFLARYGDSHRLLERMMASPLWSRLDVVRRDRVYEVPDDLWFLGIGNLAARLVVDDLETILVDEQRLDEAAGAATG